MCLNEDFFPLFGNIEKKTKSNKKKTFFEVVFSIRIGSFPIQKNGSNFGHFVVLKQFPTIFGNVKCGKW